MKAVFLDKKKVGSDIWTFRFDVNEVPKFRAGQFTHLQLLHSNPDERGEKRWFTLSSSPTEDYLSITTRLVDKRSSFKQAFSDLKPGNKMSFDEPEGDFVLPDDKSKKLVLIAGGIGVTPYRSQAKYMIDTGEKRSIELIYAARSEDDIAFKELIEEAGFKLIPFISKNLPDTEKLLSLAGDTSDKVIYISGPEQFVEKLNHDLLSKGVNKNQIKTDFFPGYEENLT
ncbi:MAG: FAD-dependent oxidoreductase [bacterium]|nr:FAD-dependent oxidoreductase [bacterium]